MTQGRRDRLSGEERSEMWGRWKAGESLHEIGRCERLAERATLPAFVFFFQLLYPFRWVCDPGRATAAAAGGTMLVSQEALRRVDGVNRISAALIDDVALAREIKPAGHTICLGHRYHASSKRIYPA